MYFFKYGCMSGRVSYIAARNNEKIDKEKYKLVRHASYLLIYIALIFRYQPWKFKCFVIKFDIIIDKMNVSGVGILIAFRVMEVPKVAVTASQARRFRWHGCTGAGGGCYITGGIKRKVQR